jgi:cyclopropane-fatty-acyl-phospholipid synthase
MDRLLDIVFDRTVRYGSLAVINAHGQTRHYGDNTGPHVTVRFTTRGWQWRVILDPELRLGEAYMDGGLVVEAGTIAEFLEILVSNTSKGPPAFWVAWLRSLRTVFRRIFHANTLVKASRNAQHHYNINYDVYRTFLDQDMQYSCAYFERPDSSLDEAQRAKKRHIAAKLLLTRPNLSVLDIGCGWGGLGLHLAKSARAHVTGVTLSDEQVKVARQRAAAERASCDFRLQDYRDVKGQFDRIVSVGMFEHVGKRYYDLFFRRCRDLLKNDGVVLLHTIGRLDGPSDTNPWVWRYIFPGGYTPALSELAPAIERSGLVLTDVEVLRLHYAETLKAWRVRFLQHREEVAKLLDQRFIRMWEYYLAGFESAFRHYGLAVFQIQLAKTIDAVPLTRDYIYAPRTEGVAVAGHGLRIVQRPESRTG